MERAYLDSPTSGWETEQDERLLIEQARGNPEAFDALYQRYLPRVFRYLLTYAETEDDAADLTQHVFLRALESLPHYQERGLPFAAWLLRIARNAATDAYRRRRRTLPWDHIPEKLHPFAGRGPEDESLRHEALNRLRVLVAQLDEDRQELLALRFAGGLTIPEIALVMGKGEAATKKQLYRTLRTLKEHYDVDDV